MTLSRTWGHRLALVIPHPRAGCECLGGGSVPRDLLITPSSQCPKHTGGVSVGVNNPDPGEQRSLSLPRARASCRSGNPATVPVQGAAVSLPPHLPPLLPAGSPVGISSSGFRSRGPPRPPFLKLSSSEETQRWPCVLLSA